MSAQSSNRTESRSPNRHLFPRTPALCIPLRSAANTLLSALENLMLIDEHGHAREQMNVAGEKAESVMGRRRAFDRMTPTPLDDQMDVDEAFEGAVQRKLDVEGPSPLKRKRDATSFPLPDAKSHRISASLSSRLQRSLRVAETDEGAGPIRNEHGIHDSAMIASSHIPHPRSSRRPSRVSRNDSCSSIPDLQRDASISSLSSPVSPVFGLSRGSSIADNIDTMSIASWIECQARRNGTTIDNMQNIWNEKRKELEYNLTLLANGVPSDSYQDLKSIIEKIMEAAKWLSAGNLDELGDLIPSWRLMERNIENVVQYIKVVEDMKATIATSFQMSGRLDADLKVMRECLEQKKEIWSDALKHDGKAWRLLGFPVDELQPLLSASATWLYGLPWGYFVQLDSELNKQHLPELFRESSTPTQYLVEHIFEGILFARDCADLVHRPFQPRVLHGAYTLTTIFITYTMSLFDQVLQRSSNKPRSAEVRVMQLYGNLVKLLEALKVMQGHFADEDQAKEPTIPPIHLAGPSAGSQQKLHALRTRVEPDFNPDSPITPDSPSIANHPSYFPTTEEHMLGQMEALDNFARVLVEAGLQLCEYIAERNAKTDGNIPQANKNILLTALAVRYVDALVRLAGLSGDGRLQSLLGKLPHEVI